MKKYEVMESKFRNLYEKYGAVASIAGGFVNFKTVNFSGSISTEQTETRNSK